MRQPIRSNRIRIEGSERIRPAHGPSPPAARLGRATIVLEVNSILVKNFIKIVYSREEKDQNVSKILRIILWKKGSDAFGHR
ncbi:hypothetical protein NQ318_008661 [Aromia moschata]|uniref:Uncharacterized protein n=1 Tax=Aromia moschata TaxID=1265417 RepID=A0AAV8XIV5_9CUCU|nr:hypothetical protein NQ318_008661 [Aromia moschata]